MRSPDDPLAIASLVSQRLTGLGVAHMLDVSAGALGTLSVHGLPPARADVIEVVAVAHQRRKPGAWLEKR